MAASMKELRHIRNMRHRMILATGLLVFLAGCQEFLSLPDSVTFPPRLRASDSGATWAETTAPGQGASPVSDDLSGGDIVPVRSIQDPYPSFHSVAVDPENNLVLMSDSNRGSLLAYERTAGANSGEATKPTWQIRGPATGMMFVAGVALDLVHREALTVDNDIGDRMEVFPYGVQGNVKPKRVLHVPHGSWGVSLNRRRDEIAISVEHINSVVIYRREARGGDAPLRVIRGPKTGLADPHGVHFDEAHDEILVANHGNWAPAAPPASGTSASGGRFQPPSIAIYAGAAEGDTEPVRVIQGAHTQLNWPMGIDVDVVHNEIAVASYGNNSVLVFRRRDHGDEAPVRVIRGNRTGIVGPMGVAIDAKNDELWVTNYADHTAIVFSRTAQGNVAPKRIIRNAPMGTPVVGFGNPGALAYDSKRDELLVPNWVSVPRILVFARLANGNVGPVRVIEGQATKLSRTMHGIAYDAAHDQIVVPVYLAGAVLVFRGSAQAEEPPIRVIQGPRTRLAHPETACLDVPHGEIIVGEDTRKAVMVFSSAASGDVAPLRIIEGRKTQLDQILGVAADPVRNLIVVSSRSKERPTGLFIFNRTDEGDVAPRAIIAGPRTGIVRIRQVAVDPEQGKIFVAVKNNVESYKFEAASPSPWNPDKVGFIGVWDITDDGDVPPKAIIKGPASGLVWPAGVALNHKDKEIYAIDSVRNGLSAFSVPELIK